MLYFYFYLLKKFFYIPPQQNFGPAIDLHLIEPRDYFIAEAIIFLN